MSFPRSGVRTRALQLLAPVPASAVSSFKRLQGLEINLVSRLKLFATAFTSECLETHDEESEY